MTNFTADTVRTALIGALEGDSAWLRKVGESAVGHLGIARDVLLKRGIALPIGASSEWHLPHFICEELEDGGKLYKQQNPPAAQFLVAVIQDAEGNAVRYLSGDHDIRANRVLPDEKSAEQRVFEAALQDAAESGRIKAGGIGCIRE